MAVVHLWADVSAAVRLNGEFGYCAIHYVALWQFVIDFVRGLLCKVQIKVRLVFQNYAPCSKISGTSVITIITILYLREDAPTRIIMLYLISSWHLNQARL